jgi:hypothetical protein
MPAGSCPDDIVQLSPPAPPLLVSCVPGYGDPLVTLGRELVVIVSLPTIAIVSVEELAEAPEESLTFTTKDAVLGAAAVPDITPVAPFK